MGRGAEGLSGKKEEQSSGGARKMRRGGEPSLLRSSAALFLCSFVPCFASPEKR